MLRFERALISQWLRLLATICVDAVAWSLRGVFDPMYCSMPGFHVLHHLTEIARIHVHWVSQWFHLTISPTVSPFCLPSIFLSRRVFSKELVLWIRWPTMYWSFTFSSISPSNEYSGLIYFWIDLFGLPAFQGTLKCIPRHHSFHQAPQLQFFSAQPSFGPTLTFVHDYWKDHSFDYMDLCKVICLLFNMLSGFVIDFFKEASNF